jgi:SAM-dependent methyltransferase
VLDLQDPVPKFYHERADFIFDGGSLDSIFDPAAALRSISKILKSGGRFLSMNTGGPNPAAYLKFFADWFMDFCTINNYEDCRVYIASYPNSLGLPLNEQRKGGVHTYSPFETIVWSFNPYVEVNGQAGYDFSMIEAQSRIHVYCIGQKGESSSSHRNPIQKHYRVQPDNRKTSTDSARRFLSSKRPVFSKGAAFTSDSVPRIDSSEYPEILKPWQLWIKNT